MVTESIFGVLKINRVSLAGRAEPRVAICAVDHQADPASSASGIGVIAFLKPTYKAIPTMKIISKIYATPVLLAFSLVCGLTISRASAEPMHTPAKMPMAEAESVGMSTEGLSRIDEVMQEHIDDGTIQGAVTAVARRGKVVHFSTHGEMDVKKGRAMEPDAIFRMASSTKPVLGVAAMMMIEEGLISPSDPVLKYIPEFADVKVAILAEPADGDVKVNPKGSGKKGKVKGKEAVPGHRLMTVDTPMTIHHLLTHTSGL